MQFFKSLVTTGSMMGSSDIGKTPQMGWNSWNHFGCNVSADLMKNTTD